VITKRRVIAGVAIIVLIPIGVLAWWLGSPLFIDKEVNEEFPLSAGALIPAGMSEKDVEAEMETAVATEVTAEEGMTGEMESATALVSGQFVDIDRLHQGSGDATIYELADGTRVLRLANLDVTNGPDLRVLLANHAEPRSRAELESNSGYIELEGLKGNKGNQNYVIPDDVDISIFNSVVIYCDPFHVVFSYASLA
jgi:Electron transfer DM13